MFGVLFGVLFGSVRRNNFRRDRETERQRQRQREKRFVRCSGILRSVNLIKAIIPDIYNVTIYNFLLLFRSLKTRKLENLGNFSLCVWNLFSYVEQLILGLMLSWKHSINFRLHHFVFTAQDFVKWPLKKFKGPLLYD